LEQNRKKEDVKASQTNVAKAQHTPTTRQRDEYAEQYQKNTVARGQRANLIEWLKEVRGWVRSMEQTMVEVEDGQAIFAAFITDMAKAHDRLWPDASTGNEQVDAHNKIRTLEQKVASLEKTLSARRNLRVTADHVALSSSEVKKLPA
jgi:hypothetical protein